MTTNQTINGVSRDLLVRIYLHLYERPALKRDDHSRLRALLDAPEQPKAEPAYSLAEKVREALARRACPNVWMVIAYEAVVKNFSHPDSGEVERLRAEIKSLRQHKTDYMEAAEETRKALLAQLAEQGALLEDCLGPVKDAENSADGASNERLYHNLGNAIRAALSTSAEPRPAQLYPNRICHAEYTAHPYRCGCLRGDEEAQRIYDERYGNASAEPRGEPIGEIASSQDTGFRVKWAAGIWPEQMPVGTKLYARPPAPVAVVLPESKGYLSPADQYADGWNACLDEVTRLNT